MHGNVSISPLSPCFLSVFPPQQQPSLATFHSTKMHLRLCRCHRPCSCRPCVSGSPREALSFCLHIHSLLRSRAPLRLQYNYCACVPASILFVSLTCSQLLVPTPRRCHLMSSFNRMGPIQLMGVSHRRWVGVMTRIPVTC